MIMVKANEEAKDLQREHLNRDLEAARQNEQQVAEFIKVQQVSKRSLDQQEESQTTKKAKTQDLSSFWVVSFPSRYGLHLVSAG